MSFVWKYFRQLEAKIVKLKDLLAASFCRMKTSTQAFLQRYFSDTNLLAGISVQLLQEQNSQLTRLQESKV